MCKSKVQNPSLASLPSDLPQPSPREITDVQEPSRSQAILSLTLTFYSVSTSPILFANRAIITHYIPKNNSGIKEMFKLSVSPPTSSKATYHFQMKAHPFLVI